MKRDDLTGVRRGKLVGVRFHDVEPDRQRTRWLFQCDCGNITIQVAARVKVGHITSCGCRHREMLIERNSVHGLSRTAEHKIWTGMINRCENKNTLGFKDYGGRGIKVCKRWRHSFVNFLKDMGKRPSPKHSIERKDNDGNYEPLNCKWGTPMEQANNSRHCVLVAVDGITDSISNTARRVGMRYRQLQKRIMKGQPAQLAVTRWRTGDLSHLNPRS